MRLATVKDLIFDIDNAVKMIEFNHFCYNNNSVFLGVFIIDIFLNENRFTIQKWQEQS